MAQVHSIHLDETRVLFYRTQDAKLAELSMGKTVRQAVEGMGVGDLVTMVWAGLRHSQEYTLDQIGDMIDKAKMRSDFNVLTLWSEIIQALIKSGIWPESKPMKAPPVPPSQASGLFPGTTEPSGSGS